MSSADPGALHSLLVFLHAHRAWAYPTLFFGAYFETLLPFSLFIPGEAVFLGGAMLAGTGALDLGAVAATLWAGGLLGDHSSYWVGRRCGPGVLARLGRRLPGGLRERGCEFFRRRGAVAVFWGRLSGPLSWITPTLAGAFELDYSTFLRFNTPGVLLGIGEFLLAGYFFGTHLGTACAALEAYAPQLAASAALAAVLLLAWRRARRPFSRTGDASRWSDRGPDRSR